MTDERVKESLSALMDGEANELEIERVLKASDDESLRATWARYHMVRSSMQRSAADSQQTSSALLLDVSAVVRETLADETVAAPTPRLPSVLRPVASFAVAASVAGAVVVGAQLMDTDSQSGGFSAAPSVASRIVDEPTGSWGGVPIAASIQVQAQAKDKDTTAIYDAMARERLQRYMLHNAEHAALNNSQGMMPFARVTSRPVAEDK